MLRAILHSCVHRVSILSMLLNVAALSAIAQTAPAKAPYMDSSLPVAERAHDLVSHMTLAEKVSEMQNHAAAIPLLVHEEANVTGIEGRGRYNSAVRDDNHSIYFGMDFWAPNVNIFRDPRWGRGQETYGEDPFLTGQMAIQFVTGLQGNDPRHYLAIATPKHFDVHSGPEPLRHKFDVNPSPHDLEDTYLPAFRAAIVTGHADSIMCAYNAVDGVPACANEMLLRKVLRGEWHFNGYVVSDCGAIGDIAHGHKYAKSIEQASVDAVRAGTDLSCGDEYATLVNAVHDGLIQESEIDTAVERLMAARIRMGILAPPDKQPYQSLDRSIVFSPEHAALDLHAAEEAMVLLKNDGVLPLRSSMKTIAVIGPNAASLAALEGNYNGTPIHPETPLAAIRALATRRHFHVLDAQGAPYVEQISLPVPPSAFRTPSHKQGLSVHYFSNTDFSGTGLAATVPNIDDNWDAASPVPQSPISSKTFSVRWTGLFIPPAPGDYQFQVVFPSCYPCVDKESYAVWFGGKRIAAGSSEGSNNRKSPLFTVHFDNTKPHAFRMEYTHESPLFGAGATFNWKPPVEALRRQAVDLAKRADVVVAIVGISPRLEGEEMPIHIPGFDGGDRTSIDLPDVQVRMLQAVAATGKPLVVVLMNGSALAVNWAQHHANAILEAWYPGARGGQAIVDTLFGKNNPAGRLPITFYSATSQLPPFTDYSTANRTYRYFTGAPLYGFGYGLSYSHFKFSHLSLSSENLSAGEPMFVQADVTNTSEIAGDEAAELYVEYPQSKQGSNGAPLRALAAFSRVHIASGATKHISFTLPPRRLSYVRADGKRVVSAGNYTIFVGGSQPSANASGVSAPFTITGTKNLPN